MIQGVTKLLFKREKNEKKGRKKKEGNKEKKK